MSRTVSKTQRKQIARFAKGVCKRHGFPERKTDLYRELKRLYEQGTNTRENVARAIMRHLPVKVKIEKQEKL